jgi:teichuronic acid exporter
MIETEPQRAASAVPALGTRDGLHLSMVRGIAWTAAAKGVIQVLTWAGTLVVARYLAPEDYGLVQLALVLLNLITQLNEMSVGFAVVTLRDLTQDQIARLNGLALVLGAASTVAACAVAPMLGRAFASPDLPLLIALLSSTFLMTAARTVPQALLQREFRFRSLAFVEAAQALVGALTTLALALAGAAYWSLALGRLAATAVWSGLTLALRRHAAAPPRLERLRHALHLSVDLSTARVAWFAYSNLHFVIVAHFLDTSVLGAFTIAWTLAHLAVDRVAALLVGVLPSYFALLQGELGELRRYLLAITETLAWAVIPLTLGISLVAADFVPLVLGERWAAAIAPLQILPLYAAFFAIASVLPHALRVVGETRLLMLCNVATAVVILLAVTAAAPFGLEAISWTWVVVYPLLTAPLYARTFARLELRGRDYLRALAPALASGLAMVAAVTAARALWPLPATPSGAAAAGRLAGMVAIGAIAYTGYAHCIHGERIRAMARVCRRALSQSAETAP